MKVAICLSGHFRKFKETFPSIDSHILKKYDCDVFIHTWDKLGYSCRYKTDQIVSSYNVNEIINLYKPKKIVTESEKFVEELKRQGDQYAPHLKNEPKHVGHMASMFYKIYAANELMKLHTLETGAKYDVIIRLRPDLFINHFNMPIINNSIFIPAMYSGENWYNDQIAIGSQNAMDLYCSMFFDMPEYFRNKGEFYPEKFVANCMRKKNLKVEFCDINYYIYR